jgi:hypothetical protein
MTKGGKDMHNARSKVEEVKDKRRSEEAQTELELQSCWNESLWPSWAGYTSMEDPERYHKPLIVVLFTADTNTVIRVLVDDMRCSDDLCHPPGSTAMPRGNHKFLSPIGLMSLVSADYEFDGHDS